MASHEKAKELVPYDPLDPLPVITGTHDPVALSESLFAFSQAAPGKGWLTMFAIAGGLATMLLVLIGLTVWKGIGLWGNNIPVGWGFGIINLVWWIGIGHAGTLISAILLLFQQQWRTSINRFSEAMTLFAVICAAMYPALHTGRPWMLFYFFPYPSALGIWPQFKSPLTWDTFAISTYFTVSLLFWFIGLVPDLATLRDHAKTPTRRFVYGLLALGWRGSARAWRHWKIAYLLLAGISTPLVLSVHSIISFDFAVAIVPGWHTTIFPPYFVAGAVFSGFAMVLTLMIPAREHMGLKHVVTEKHIDNMCKVMLVTGMIVAYGYAMEHFIAWYSGAQFEYFIFYNRRWGPYRTIFWIMVFCNCILPNIWWHPAMRRNLVVVWVASLLVNVGMWAERFVIVVTSLHRDFLPSKWEIYYPTWVDIGIFVGTMGLFSTLFLLFLRFLPAIPAFEVQELRAHLLHEHARGEHAEGAH
jgi:molybdopterin-containing oxidoreductase family membrane subunit